MRLGLRFLLNVVYFEKLIVYSLIYHPSVPCQLVSEHTSLVMIANAHHTLDHGEEGDRARRIAHDCALIQHGLYQPYR